MKAKVLFSLALVVGFVILGAGAASAQITSDVLKVNYFSNNDIVNAPFAKVRIDNPGTFGAQNLCAMIYVFDQDQQLSECCGCLETPDGLRTLSVFRDLNYNALTAHTPINGVIKIISAEPGTGVGQCDPTSNVVPKPTLRAWGTHIQDVMGTGDYTVYPTTETEFEDAQLSTAELTNLQVQCALTNQLGSGQGVCSCGTGD